MLSPHLPYVSFESTSMRAQAQGIIDADRDIMGRFIITGPQNEEVIEIQEISILPLAHLEKITD